MASLHSVSIILSADLTSAMRASKRRQRRRRQRRRRLKHFLFDRLRENVENVELEAFAGSL